MLAVDMLLELRRLPRSDKRDAERDYTGSSIFSRRRFALGFQSRGVCSFVWANSHNRYFYLVVGLLAPIPAPPLHPRGQLSRVSAGRGNLAWPSRYIGARAPRRRAFEACAMDDFYKDALRFGCLQVRPSCVPFVSAPAAGRSAGAASASSPVANIPSLRPRTPPTSAQGFKHFSVYLRGREELLITVHHRDDPGPFPSNDAIQDGNGSASRCVSRAHDAPHSPSRYPPSRPSVPR